MIIGTLQKVADYITDNGLDSGYQKRFLYLDDARDKGQAVLLIKISGNGTNQRYLGATQSIYDGIELDICITDDRSNTLAMYSNLNAIRDLFVQDVSGAGLVGSRVMSNISSPAQLDDDRIMIRFMLRVYES